MNWVVVVAAAIRGGNFMALLTDNEAAKLSKRLPAIPRHLRESHLSPSRIGAGLSDVSRRGTS